MERVADREIRGRAVEARVSTLSTRIHRSPTSHPWLLRLFSSVVSRSTPVDATSFRRDARERAFAQLVRLRLVVAPVLGSLAIALAAFEPAPWRRAVLASVVCVLWTVSAVEFLRYRRHGIVSLMVPLNLVVMLSGQIALVVATGGLFSPVVPPVILMGMVAAVLVERTTLWWVVGAVELPALWALAFVHSSSRPVASLVPALFGDPGELEHGAAPWIAAGLYSLMLVLASRIGLAVRGIFEELFDAAIHERDRALAMHAEQSRALTALSAEVAHELKNPLASVKGLASLVARGAEGKTAERLGVLRREADRMETILEELLNFSRPLLPLAMEDVDLAELVQDVAKLHEATAAELRIPIEVHASTAVEVRCDPRKVRQVVINLVQNALDASAPGAPVQLTVYKGRSVSQVRVADRGTGLDSAVAERIFDPGVTTKEHGSGLGLVVARGLARQHGGELLLANRDGGGTVAELTLPNEPSESA